MPAVTYVIIRVVEHREETQEPKWQTKIRVLPPENL